MYIAFLYLRLRRIFLFLYVKWLIAELVRRDNLHKPTQSVLTQLVQAMIPFNQQMMCVSSTPGDHHFSRWIRREGGFPCSEQQRVARGSPRRSMPRLN